MSNSSMRCPRGRQLSVAARQASPRAGRPHRWHVGALSALSTLLSAASIGGTVTCTVACATDDPVLALAGARGLGAQGESALSLQLATPGLCDGMGAPRSCDGSGCTASRGSVAGGASYGLPGGMAARPRMPSRYAASAGGFCEEARAEEPVAPLHLSVDDSASLAAPALVRSLIRRGRRPQATLIRSWEFLNYYSPPFIPAEPGEVRVAAALSGCRSSGELSLQVAVISAGRTPSTRPALNLTFLIDTSGSMGGEGIERARVALRALATSLRKGDIISAMTWATEQHALLEGHVVSGEDDPVLIAALQRLSASGSTDLHSALVRGYELAAAHHSPERINRVVLISDGGANVGNTDEELIGRHADAAGEDPEIYLAAVGVGASGAYDDTIMDRVSDLGRGAHVYLDSDEEARRMFTERFTEVLDVAVRDVKLSMTLPWYLSVRRFYGEEMSTDASAVRAQHLGPNDSMVFFQVLRACDPGRVRGADLLDLHVSWQLPGTREQRELDLALPLSALANQDRALSKASAIAVYADSLRIAAGQSESAARATLQQALDGVGATPGSDRDADLVEVASLLETYLRLLRE